MKAKYFIPTTEVIEVKAGSLLVSVSGAGLNDGGTDNGTHIPRAPGRAMPY
jgi:hypothetical protein